MNLFASILSGILAALPGLVKFAEDLHGSTPGSGPAKLQLVQDAVGTGASVAGVVDPTQQQLIRGIATAATNSLVAVQNATAAAQPAAPTAPAEAQPAAPAAAGTISLVPQSKS